MNYLADTIVALSTPHSGAPLAIVRLSGPDAADVFRKLARNADLPEHFHVKNVTLDLPGFPVPVEADALFMRAPNSYTTEDVVELHVPGALPLAAAVVEAAAALGARSAEPGEFTRRAFLGGRLDLSQAEAVQALISAAGRRDFRLARLALAGGTRRAIEEIADEIFLVLSRIELGIDFAEQDIELAPPGEFESRLAAASARITALLPDAQAGAASSGARVLVAGRPNAGKSTLFNLLAGGGYAITHREPGTTRDYLTASAQVGGVPVVLVDTAGIALNAEGVEAAAVRASLRQVELADVVLYMVDASAGMDPDEEVFFGSLTQEKLLVFNKTDLANAKTLGGAIPVSCGTGEGIENLKGALSGLLTSGRMDMTAGALIVAARQRAAVESAIEKIGAAIDALKRGMSEEFVAIEVRESLDALGEITGRTTPDDVLDAIFSDFCIGK